MISSNDESNSDNYEPDIDKQHDQMIEDLWHRSSLHVVFVLGKITKILQNYPKIEKLSHFDINLIKSFYSKDHLQAMYEKQTVVC